MGLPWMEAPVSDMAVFHAEEANGDFRLASTWSCQHSTILVEAADGQLTTKGLSGVSCS